MSTHPGMLIAYDADGNVVATLDYMVSCADDADRTPLGLIDFAAHEDAGGEMTDVWSPTRATGSKVWPEWIGASAHDFRVEKAGPPGRKYISALVHKTSGHRRERATVEAEIGRRIADAKGGPADIRDLVGGPDRPILLDGQGRTTARVARSGPELPIAREAPSHPAPGAGNRAPGGPQ